MDGTEERTDEIALPRIFIESNALNKDELEVNLAMVVEKLKSKKSTQLPTINPDDLKKDAIQRRIDESNKVLGELLRDGNELVTNIRIANDKREIDRRADEAQLREDLLDKLNVESETATLKFQGITERWKELETVKDPFNMHEGLEEQKERIRELTHQKDDIIMECWKELKKADERYYHDQEKQASDIVCLVERVDHHIEAMKSAYRKHLDVLQQTIDQERSRIKAGINKKWEDLYGERQEKEKKKLLNAKEKSDFFEAEIERITVQHEELTRATKINLEHDNEALQLELQRVKANILLNSEKLDYNFEVLKRREEENVIIRCQQKKRLMRMSEAIVTLKRKIKDTTAQCDGECGKLQTEISRLQTQVRDIEASAAIFADTSDSNYRGIWEMNYSEAMKLLNQILEIDEQLHVNQLGAEAPSSVPQLNILEDLPSFQAACETIEQEKKKNLSQSRGQKLSLTAENASESSILREICEKIADQSEFLIEKKLEKLIGPLREDDEKLLVKVNNIFTALGIENVENLLEVQQHFLQYAYCAHCSQKHTEISTQESHECENSADSVHELVLEMPNVLSVLREFMEEHKDDDITENDPEITSKMRLTLSRLLDPAEVRNFWQQFRCAFPEEKERLWQGLEYGLTEYLNVLREREKLDSECGQLRRQNEELRHLLQKYVEGCENSNDG
ncbi:dynein regulatory complex protein 1 homolog [Phlebotomus argentipes]|uniref:dynein regulatory complex protein 1 homolog n=1 Tax=Phlebotomus argentipes TaxID=94469 RepID=UPI0028929833|nr:dynein regulatory complex protein 1 homolog [Phlebotomus argentipes]